MNILLINPPCDPRTIGLRNMAKIEPLGLETVGAGVNGKHDVRLVDMEVEPRDLERELDQFAPDIVGVTSEIVHVSTAIDALQSVRRRYPKCLTVVGGHHATMRPEDFAHPVVDLIVLGEGVYAFAEICDARARGGGYDAIAGLAIVQPDGSLRRTPGRMLPIAIDDYPFPDRSLTARYRDRYYYIFEPSVAAVRTSFGCTAHCTFCSVRVYSEGHFISRSAELVFQEIASLKEKFVMFCDDHSFNDPERMRRLGQMLLDAGIEKRYFAYSRADSIVKHRDVFELWAKVGLSIVMTGLEAMDEVALKRRGKQTTQSINEQAVQIAHDLGFYLSAGFLVEPDFERHDFERIDRYARAHPSILITEYTSITPFPGTPLYKQDRAKLITHDPAFFDLQHFVMPTELSSRELYALLKEYYGRSVMRVMTWILQRRPWLFVSRHALRIVWGLLKNAVAYDVAHLHLAGLRVEQARALAEATPASPDAANAAPGVTLRYHGWSGWTVHAPNEQQPTLVFDPAPDQAWPDHKVIALITHGHPEHLEGVRTRLRQRHRAPVTVVASRAVCKHLRRSSAHGEDRFVPAAPKQRVEVEGWSIRVFGWRHMSLLPPEPNLAFAQLGFMLRRPRKLLEIGLGGLLGPRATPMLGYEVSGAQLGQSVIYFGEGLHRRTTSSEVAEALGEGPGRTLVVGVEPEDVERVVALLSGADVDRVAVFEPHRPWREHFGMPQLDATSLVMALAAAAVPARRFEPGEELTTTRALASEIVTEGRHDVLRRAHGLDAAVQEEPVGGEAQQRAAGGLQ